MGESDARNCGACTETDAADEAMIECSKCAVPFHLQCANIAPGTARHEWMCPTCVSVLVVSEEKEPVTDTTKKKKKKSSRKAKPDDRPEKRTTRSKSAAALGGAKKKEPPKKNDAASETTPSRRPGQSSSRRKISFDKKSIQSTASSARARAQLALQRLEAEQKLEKRKLEEERRQLEEEKAMRRKEQALRKKEIELLERSLKVKYDLEEKIVEDGGSIVSGDQKTEEWLKKQLAEKKKVPESADESESSSYEDDSFDDDDSWAPSDPDTDIASSASKVKTPSRREETPPPQPVPPRVPQRGGLPRPHGAGPTGDQLAARQIWPKKLPIFSGDPEDWPMFNSSFDTGNTACGFTEVENLIRLRESLQGPARDAVATKLMFPHCVPQIMETLRRLYGRPELLVKNLLTKVRQLEAPRSERLDTLMTFGMAVQQLCDHLEAANLRGHLSNPTLLDELVEKLPASYKMNWVRYKRKFAEPTLKEFGRFMERLVEDASEVTSLVKPKQSNFKTEKARPKEKGHLNAHSDVSKTPETVKPRTPCPICGKDDHRVRNCEKFGQISLDARLRAVEQHKLCEVCLFDHGDWRCRSRIHCNVGSCRGRHHPLLHKPATVANRVVPSDCHTHGHGKRSVLFRVVPVTLFNGNWRLDTYAFLDEGSSLTLIEAGIANSLGVDGTPEPLQLKWTASVVRNEDSSKRVNIQIAGRGLRNRYTLKAAHTVDQLNLPGQSLFIDELTARYGHLRNLPVESYSEAVPRVLVGLDNLELFAPLECHKGQPGDPIAVKSLLGWAVYGPSSASSASLSSASSSTEEFLNLHSCDCEVDTQLNEMIRQQFVLDEAIAPGMALPESAEDKRARELLDQTTVFLGERYETGLLWKTDDVSLPDSLPMAARRMKCLEAKLAKDPELRENVQQQIHDYVRKGYAHKASAQELSEADRQRTWYLPLNVVSHPRKPGKKRLVWDAAAQVDGISLNSQLLKGPDQLVSLPSVICKFRERRIGFGGDIREMFHQILIRPVDRHSQRFLFRFDSTQPPDVYLMDVATFGATCSPCSAQHILRKNADQYAEEFPDAVVAIKSKTYMDDYYDSADTPEEAALRAVQVKDIHARAGFDMRNWVSNSSEVLQTLGESAVQAPRELASEEETKWERVLGMTWDPASDVFSFSTSLRAELMPYVLGERRPTKRMALRIIMSLFDPLGLLAPFIIHGRMLVQDLWRSGLQWDEEMLDDDFEKWMRWTGLLPKISRLQIQRCYFGSARPETYRKVQVHVFTDASDKGYGCAAYFRIAEGEEVRCALVMSKAKVAPLKHLSIPRMELEAAVQGARLLQSVRASHTYEIGECFLWTDSSTVLAWIRSDHRKYKQFVAHRIGEILSMTQPESWRWVPSKSNIADSLTKWGKNTEMESDSEWFAGPAFLYLPQAQWPQQRKAAENVQEELRSSYQLHHISLPTGIIDASRISKWTVLVRTMACVYRFVNNCRRRVNGLPIEALEPTEQQALCVKRFVPAIKVQLQQEEFLRAEQWLFRIAQGECYPDEVKTLLRNRDATTAKRSGIEKSSPLYKMSAFADEFGILRVEGRTEAAAYAPFDARFPIILPRGHLITVRLLDHYHRRFGHASRETVVNEVRQRYDIPQLRSAVDKVMKDCQRCKVKKCKPQFPRMAPLPKQRLTPYVRPFSYVGVDYLGPLEVTIGKRKEKRYVVVFTCLVTRAVHLDIAFTLSTQSCVMAIRRFVRKRGSPVEIFSDNGTNFVGASRLLIRQINNDCAATFTDAHTKWSFNPPSAPHMGGVWERMVRSVKEAMDALDDGRSLTDEVLLTVLAETEGFINARPLTYMPQTSADREALTPNHFIFGNSSGSHEPLREPVNLAEALRDSYQRSQRLADDAWKRWLAEYFPTINKRTKWLEEVESVKIGDLVYVADGDRRSWIRGRIDEVIVGRDGRVRQAVVQTATGKLKRPVVKLVLMEVSGAGESGRKDESGPDPRGGGCSGSTVPSSCCATALRPTSASQQSSLRCEDVNADEY